MKNKTIIIPSAKNVLEELQQVGKLPSVIYPINQDIVFDYLYKQYSNYSFKVIAYENADKVHRRLSKYKDVLVEDLDKLGDLGYTLYYATKDINGSGFINFGDTILLDNLDSNEKDIIYYSIDNMSSTWTFFEEKNGIISKIIDKKSINSSKQAKLFVGVFKINDFKALNKCLKQALDNKKEGISSFYQGLIEYSKSHPFKIVKTDKWFDIGHIDKYYDSQTEVRSREFNHIKIDKDRGILRKESDDKDKFIGEIKWYLKLPADIEYVRPRIFDYSTSYNNPYVSMEYYSYHTIHELFLYGDLSKNQWIEIFKKIRFVLEDFRRYEVKDSNIKNSLEETYLIKTIDRLNKLKENDSFKKFFNHSITINDKKYKSLNEIIDILNIEIPKRLYRIKTFNIIHGDLCFANIMVDSNFSFIKVIDPRGKFGDFDIYGDQRYELAKLFHSVDGKYDFIIKDLFDIDYDTKKCIIDYQVNDRKRDYDLHKLFKEIFSKEISKNLKNIELIEALLFLSMIPLHNESINHQMAMLSTGIEILNRVINIEEE